MKILVVDDSAVVRLIISSILEDEGDFIVQTASNGKQALSLFESFQPDLITLDIEMPVMDGLETLKQIRTINKQVPIIMLSSLTERGSSITIDALLYGASDYITKPAGYTNQTEVHKEIKASLIPVLYTWLSKRQKNKTDTMASLSRKTDAPNHHPHKIAILVIGASTGGPQALMTIFSNFSMPLSVPMLIVQHMPPVFTKTFANRLNDVSSFPVHEVTQPMPLLAGNAYLAPGDFHLEVEGSSHTGLHGFKNPAVKPRININKKPHVNSCRPSVDVLFTSAAAAFGKETLGLILTGMGKDGLEGCRSIREEGGYILAQDAASCVIWGMPKFVVEAKLAHQIVPLTEIATTIQRII